MIGKDDQRSYYRMMVNAECFVDVYDAESTSQLSAVCRDLSANGMAVAVDSAVDHGKEVKVHIESTNSQIPSLSAKGKVLRCKQEADNSWVLGIEITDFD